MRRFTLLIALCLGVMGCSSPTTFVGAYDFKDQNWSPEQNVVFDFNTLKTNTTADLLVCLRYLPQATGQKFRLAVRTTNHRNVSFTDTLNIELTRGSGDGVRSIEIIVRRNVIWPRSEPHYITLAPNTTLDNIVSLSLQIDNAAPIN